MITKKQAENIVKRIGAEVLKSDGMQKEKGFLQHGNVSVYRHSLSVAAMCILIAAFLRAKVNKRSLVRGALLHDYFLYDWHVPDKSHKWHGFHHAKRALHNAERDFKLDDVEKNMILSHMFPMNMTLPKHKESVILCLADKICALKETVTDRKSKAPKKDPDKVNKTRKYKKIIK